MTTIVPDRGTAWPRIADHPEKVGMVLSHIAMTSFNAAGSTLSLIGNQFTVLRRPIVVVPST